VTVVPGGFGTRGVEGMMLAAKHAREHKVPFFGVCLGFQTAVIQFARDKCGLSGANSEEFHEFAEDKVIMYMPDVDRTKMGGTMRLGLKKTIFQDGTEWSKVRKLYGGEKMIEERHRHRYEVNPDYVERLSGAGISFIGKDETGKRMSIFELRDHPYYIGEWAVLMAENGRTLTDPQERSSMRSINPECWNRA
jgi:CTP synthase